MTGRLFLSTLRPVRVFPNPSPILKRSLTKTGPSPCSTILFSRSESPFVGNETTTVAGGTYSNTAHLRVELLYTDPAVFTGSTDQPVTEARDLYLSPFVGLVLATNKSVTQNVVGTLDSNGNDYTYTETEDGRSELISATVNGTNYPPGRSVSAFGASTSRTRLPFMARREANREKAGNKEVEKPIPK